MDIIAKAKPVRFRIVSGGVECTSLDDLRAHFDLKSVADTINDGRLEKWLNYIKEFEFAKQVRAIGKFESSDMKMSLRVLSLFTGKEYNLENFMSDIEFIKFLDSDKNTSGFALDLMKESIHKDVDVLLYAYHNHDDLIPDVHAYFAPFLNCGNPEVLWEYGFDLLTSPSSTGNKEKEQEGISYIKKAAQKGWKDAANFLITKIIREDLAKASSDKISSLQLKSKKRSYSDGERELFKICAVISECVDYSWTFSSINEQLKKNAARFFNNQYRVVIDFLIIYSKESSGWDGDDGAIAKYKRLNYEPANQRAKDLSKRTYSSAIITTNQNVKIKMPINPDIKEYHEFVIELLSNILYF